ncbi:calcium-transporting ATPase 4, plasma membrane-type-like [Ipomoea triloba]|uniref:calcium-transporting ATPase 4, plasma membrane-type-like n=1 Tax=Ipomoea triloba TaxID=35885 RepID=UPI00125DCA3F|nr:calcium-transporting ATPase 4, plasma membrane-type-like [Ipomoea triloba]
MEPYLTDFDVPPKHPSEEAQKRWRKAVFLVRNHRRRFRYGPNFEKRSEAKELMDKTREKLRVGFMAYLAALKFLDAGDHGKHPKERIVPPVEDLEDECERGLPEEAKNAGFRFHPDKLATIVGSYDIRTLRKIRGVEGLASRLGVSLSEGVKTSDVPLRQNVYGSNKFTEKPFRSFWTFVWEALHDLTLIILIVCAAVSIGVGLATEGWPKGTYDGLGIILSIFLVVFVTAISDYRQSLQFRDLDKEKKKIFVQVTRDGYRQKVSIYDLVVGDVVHLNIGDLVPADGVFISGYSLLIDQSSLSGESVPVNISEKRPFLLSGTKVQDGSAMMLVTTVGMRTEWGKLMETLSESGEDETPLQVKLNGVATIIGKIGLGFAVLTFLVLVIRFLVEKALKHEFSNWSSADALILLNHFATAVTIIVVAVPEGLPLAVTLSLAFAMKQLMDNKALVRTLSACETMGSATCICTDKTGTLTTNHMVVTKTWMCGKVRIIETGEGGSNNIGSEISENVLAIILQAIFHNTGAEVVTDKDGNRSILGTPTESAIVEYGLLLGGELETQRKDCKVLKVEPFNSEKKKMSVLVELPNGNTRAFCKGASEIVLRMCNSILHGNGEIVDLPERQAENIMDVINEFAGEALRTICLAFKDIEGNHENNIPGSGYTLIAVVGIKDPVRPGVKDAVKTCLAAGIRVRMVTGDNINTAKAIAKECGILTEDGFAIEGPEFRSKTPDEMRQIIPRIQVMARSSPLDKHVLVKNLRGMFREVVAVTGDGTNDAPALHEADIGLAMGIAGTEVAKESADVIVLDDNFTTIVNVAKWGRSVYINIQKFVQFQLTVNVVALIINFVSACISGSAPLTAVQLLWVNLIMDTLGALALATEPPHEGLMNRPPVGRDVSFITKAMWRNIIGQSIYQLAILLVFNFFGIQLLRLEGSDAHAVLNTFIFNTFVFCQLFNEVNSRDIEKLNVFRGLFGSWIFLGVVICTTVFQAIIVEFLGTFATTVPLSWQLWVLSVLIGAASMIISIILKLIPVKKETPKHHNGYDLLASGPDQA